MTRELLDLALRWVHVIAAIMWVGNSMLFNWLDRNLKPAAAPRDRSMGEIWLLHSGGFYQVEKTLAIGDVPVQSVHWFKWQAYIAWMSGAALLFVVYYMSGGALLTAAGSGLSSRAAITIGIATVLGGWIVYEMIWRSPLGRVPALATAICAALLVALAWKLTGLFNGRAAFLHVGALLGTVMAANVRMHIMPSQRQFIAEIEHGRPGDERLAKRAKLHSIHNNYITFPVIALMVSNHFPSLYGSAWSWLVICVLIAAGAAVRHLLNIRYSFQLWQPALAATIVLALGALYMLSRPVAPASGVVMNTPVTFETAEAVVRKRCTVCHSASAADRSMGTPPVLFDTAEQIRALAPRIRVRAVETRTMPPANKTFLTEEERSILERWTRVR